MTLSNDPGKEGLFKTNVGKGENAGNQHFLLLPQRLYHFRYNPPPQPNSG